MAVPGDTQRWQPDRYQELLRTVARLQLAPELRDCLDSSDVVQMTLLKAHQKLGQFRGQTTAEFVAWLRRILANTLIDELRHRFGRGPTKKPVRVQSLEAAIADSSVRLEQLLADSGSSPSGHIEKEELLLRLADALGRLPENQRVAIELRWLETPPWKVAAIAAQLGCTPDAVGGLIYRGLTKLREVLSEKR